jgi:hypothetical protein
MTMAIDILTPVGRVVGGHPMKAHPVTDDKTGQPKLRGDGTPRMQVYVGLAVPKQGETRWQDTEWGRQIFAVGQGDWPNGEWQAPSFAWKITDGDSTVPNKRGRKPAEREGYPGHWVISATTELSVRCYHAGRYQPHEMIQRAEEIKCGDYARLYLQVKGNNPSQSPGVYINPTMFELTRAGVEIITNDGPDASAAFGAVPAQVPAGAQLAPVQPAPAVPTPTTPPPTGTPVQPHPGFVTGAAMPPPAPPVHQMTPLANGATYEQMIAAGWTDALLVQHGMMLP